MGRGGRRRMWCPLGRFLWALPRPRKRRGRRRQWLPHRSDPGNDCRGWVSLHHEAIMNDDAEREKAATARAIVWAMLVGLACGAFWGAFVGYFLDGGAGAAAFFAVMFGGFGTVSGPPSAFNSSRVAHDASRGAEPASSKFSKSADAVRYLGLTVPIGAGPPVGRTTDL